MPEGPEVRALVDRLQGGVGRSLKGIQLISGRYVEKQLPVGYTDFVESLKVEKHQKGDNSNIISKWSCKGKFIYIIVKNNNNNNHNPDYLRSIWITLGLSGRLVNEVTYQNKPSHTRWCLELGQVTTNDDGGDDMNSSSSISNNHDADTKTKSTRVYYQDVRNFGTLKFCFSQSELIGKLASLGPDIFDLSLVEFQQIWQTTRVQSTNVCVFLMNQARISGIGNYLLSESLYKAKIDPFAAMSELSAEQIKDLYHAMCDLVNHSYDSQRPQQSPRQSTSSSSSSQTPAADRPRFKLQIYGQKTCAQGLPVCRETNGPHGRSIFYTEQQLSMPLEQRRRMNSNTLTKPPTATSTISPDRSSTSQLQQQQPRFSTFEKIDSANATEKLLSGLIEPSWKAKLQPYFESDSFQNLATFIDAEIQSGAVIYPPTYQSIFHALNVCPFNQVKVIIVGQDPYHGPGQAHGLAFSVEKKVAPPPSLKNIFKEICNDPEIKLKRAPPHGHLESWAEQGVLLLNTVLTVRSGIANSHAKRGWELFTDEVIRLLAEDRSDGLVFLLWGSPAAKKAANVDPNVHAIIKTSHPSPLGATKTSSPFLGSRCFSRCNHELERLGKEVIDWTVK